MKKLILGLAALCLGPAAHAQLYNVAHMHVIFEPNNAQDGKTLTLGEEEAILSTTGYSPRAVKLEEDVTVGTLGSGYNLKKGDVLFGRYDDTVWTYCGFFQMNAESTAASAAALGVLTAGFTLLLEPFVERGDMICAYDANNDGKFDSGWGNSNVQKAEKSSFLIYSLAEKKLSSEVAYTKIDPREGVKMPIDLIWKKQKNSARIQFILRMAGERANSKFVDIPVVGEDPVPFELAGVKMKLKSYDATNETVTVEVEEGFQPRYERIRAIQIVTYSYY